jgi:hypothetical protein
MRSRTFAQADVTVSQQYAAVFARETEMPERKLFVAVLMSAIEDFRGGLRSPNHGADPAFRKLEAWFFSRDDRWPFSFENVCAQLDLDADLIRARLNASLASS